MTDDGRIRFWGKYRKQSVFDEDCARCYIESCDVADSYRFLVCGNYTAFYKVEGDAVHIVCVLLGRRNFMQILFEKSYDE